MLPLLSSCFSVVASGGRLIKIGEVKLEHVSLFLWDAVFQEPQVSFLDRFGNTHSSMFLTVLLLVSMGVEVPSVCALCCWWWSVQVDLIGQAGSALLFVSIISWLALVFRVKFWYSVSGDTVVYTCQSPIRTNAQYVRFVHTGLKFPFLTKKWVAQPNTYEWLWLSKSYRYWSSSLWKFISSLRTTRPTAISSKDKSTNGNFVQIQLCLSLQGLVEGHPPPS